jgi:hypothetical protein
MAKTTTTAKLAKKNPLAPTPRPDWQSPRVPQPVDAIKAAKPNILMQAQALVGISAPPNILAAIIIAQAADRLGEKLIEAAAVGRYRGT